MSLKLFKKAAAAVCMTAVLFSASFSAVSPETVKADVSVLKGDINGNGKVNVLDTVRMKQNALSGKEDFPITNWRKITGADTGKSIRRCTSDHKKYILRSEKNAYGREKVNTFDGIDVSRWQGDIDWNRVRRAGIDFVMIKAGEGTSVERNFIKNITGAKKAGIQCGVYWFANARNIAECHAEARACLETIKPYELDYPVVYDFEYRTLNDNPLATDRKGCTDVMITFLKDVESAGYYVMVYSNKDFPQRYLEIDRLTSQFDFWYANYSISSPDVVCNMWQRSCKGRIDGIDADVDLDISYVDYRDIMIKFGLNGFPRPNKIL